MNSHDLLHQLEKEEGDGAGWISDLRSAWDDEIEHHMSDEKKKFFLLFPSSSEEEEAENDTKVKKNKKIRKHMKTFIKEAYTTTTEKRKQPDVFFGVLHNEKEEEEFDHVLSKPQVNVDVYTSSTSSTTSTTDTLLPSIAESKSEFPSIVDTMEGGALVSKKTKKNLLQRVLKQSLYKSESEIVEDLIKYEVKLQKWIDDNKCKLNELRNQEKNHSKQHAMEMESLIKIGHKKHVKLLQTLNIYKSILLNEKMEMENQIKEALRSNLFLTKQAFLFHKHFTNQTVVSSSNRIASLPKYINDDFFKDSLDEFCIKSSIIKHLEKRIETLQEKMNTIKVKSKNNNTNILKTILQNFTNSLMDSIQIEFDQIIGDERNAEGANLSKFFKECNFHGLHRIPPREIVEYIESYVNYLQKVHKLSNCYEKLLFLTERFVFAQIGYSLFKIEMQNNLEIDTLFMEHCLLLKNLTPIQLGVDPKFLPLQEQTIYFEEPIKELQFVGFYCTPIEMLQTIQSVAKKIQRIALEHCTSIHGKEFNFGADEFFPILVYCCVQSQLPMGHACISYLSKYANKSQTEAEMQYYLTCLEGCLSYIGNITEEEVKQLCL